MLVKYRSGDGRFEVEFDEPDNQSLFEKVAAFQEVFENNDNVVIDGVKISPSDLRFRFKGAGTENKFYELSVVEGHKMAGYRLDYATTKNGAMMFPRRKDRDGNVMKNNGWYRYESVKKDATETVAKEQKSAAELSKNAPY